MSCRFCTSRDDTLVTLNNIVDKIKILDNFKQYPVTFDRVSNDNNKYNDSEVFYNKFCKYTLGISLSASSILILGELGRFPISVRSAVLGIQYWLHLEHGTENIILNHAFQTMKSEKHAWLQNIKYFYIKMV